MKAIHVTALNVAFVWLDWLNKVFTFVAGLNTALLLLYTQFIDRFMFLLYDIIIKSWQIA